MMEEKNSSKKVLLSVLGVAILVVAVVGISFAVFSFTNTNAGENSINTGTITMSYSEPEAGLNLTDQLPIPDEQGKEQTDFFQFTVSTTTTGNVKVPYEISIAPVTVTDVDPIGTCNGTGSVTKAECDATSGTWALTTTGMHQLPAANVKVYLTKVTDETETPVVDAALVSTFNTVSTLRPAEAATSYVFASIADDTAAAETTTTTYRLRMWIDSDTAVDQWTANTYYQYKLLVNVDSTVAALS